MFVNERWCKPGHCMVKVELCCEDIELLAVSVRPFYLPREFTHVIVIAVYMPPSAKADTACDTLLSVTTRLQTQHPQALFLISGDFNHAPPTSVLPTFTQYVTCTTRNNKTSVLCQHQGGIFYIPHCLADLTTTLSIYSLCIDLWCTGSLWSDAW